MLRRKLIAGLTALSAVPNAARAESFAVFLHQLRAKARHAGIPAAIISATTAHLAPNAQVLKLDAHQPEFTETYAQYAAHVLSATRIANGQGKYAATQPIFAALSSHFGIAPAPLLGIWGLETNFGLNQGDFNVIDALATLAWARDNRFFGREAIAAMRIISQGAAPATQLTGSYAGAMGQPQFMPSTYLSSAISFSGQGAADIWHSSADSLASMANYLRLCGWRAGEPASEPVYAHFVSTQGTGRDNIQTIAYWQSYGVQRLPGAPALPDDFPAALLLPDGANGQAFLIYRNFTVIRRYNPSDFYALATTALGRAILS